MALEEAANNVLSGVPLIDNPDPVPRVVPGAGAAVEFDVHAVPQSRSTRPVLPALRAAHLAPINAPAPRADGMIEFWRNGGKLGNASVRTRYNPKCV